MRLRKRKKTVRGSCLRRGVTKSCRCLASGNNRLEYGEASKRELFHSYPKQAADRGYEWGLLEEQFFHIVTQDCHYCGAPPAQIHKRNKTVYGSFIYNGIDRVDNTIGYLPNNVVPCCFTCNKAKSAMSTERFLDWIRRVYVKNFS